MVIAHLPGPWRGRDLEHAPRRSGRRQLRATQPRGRSLTSRSWRT